MAGCVRVPTALGDSGGAIITQTLDYLSNDPNIYGRLNLARQNLNSLLARVLGIDILPALDISDPDGAARAAQFASDLENYIISVEGSMQPCDDSVVDGQSCYDATTVNDALIKLKQTQTYLEDVLSSSPLFLEHFGCALLTLPVPLNFPSASIVERACVQDVVNTTEAKLLENIQRVTEAQGIFEGKIRCFTSDDPEPPSEPTEPPISEECCTQLTTAINNLVNIDLNVDFAPVLSAIANVDAKVDIVIGDIDAARIEILTAIGNLDFTVNFDVVLNAIAQLSADFGIRFDAIDVSLGNIELTLGNIEITVGEIKVNTDNLIICCNDIQVTLQIITQIDANVQLVLDGQVNLRAYIEAQFVATLQAIADLQVSIGDVVLRLDGIDINLTAVLDAVANLRVYIEAQLTGIEATLNLIIDLINNLTIDVGNINCDVDLTEVINRLTDIQNALNVTISGSDAMTVCDPREDVYIAGGTVPNTEIKNYAWTGVSFVGISQQLVAVQAQLKDTVDVICKLAEVTPIFHVTDPNEKLQEFTRTTELRITYVRAGVGLKRSSKDSTWHIVIPNARLDLTWADIAGLVYEKGTFPGRLNIVGQKRIGIYGNFRTKEEGEAFLAAASLLSTETYEPTPRITLSGSSVKRTVTVETLYPISATLAVFDSNSTLIEAYCYRPPPS